MEQSERKPRHIARTPQGGQPKEEPTKTYVVKEGQTWGTNPELQAGDTVELTEAEAAGFEDKLEPANGSPLGAKPTYPEGSQPSRSPQEPPPFDALPAESSSSTGQSGGQTSKPAPTSPSVPKRTS